tara:strand:+ start:201 stop:497 length:297 start_codon:yes stop_codon:yes gene_type:complete
VAEEFDIDEQTVVEMEKYLLLGVREDISKATGRSVLLNKFVNFTIPNSKLENYKERLRESLENKSMTEFQFNRGMKNIGRLQEKVEKQKIKIKNGKTN